MKKSRIAWLIAGMLLVSMLLTSCSNGAVSSVDKFLNEDYDPTETTYSAATGIYDLNGYTVLNVNGSDLTNSEFAIFTSTAAEAISYKIFSLRSGKVVRTIAEPNTMYTFNLIDDAPVVFVTKVKIDPAIDVTQGLDNIIDTTYEVYDATGELVVSSDNAVAPVVFADLVIYDYVTYSVSEEGELKEEKTVPEYLMLEDCLAWNEDYYYVTDDNVTVAVYDHDFNLVSVWNAPSYAMEDLSVNVLNNGDILVQYVKMVDEDAKKYDLLFAVEEILTVKADLVTLLISAKNGEEKELDVDFVIENVRTNYELYDADEENNRYNDKFENIATISYIVDKQIDESATGRDIVLMNNKGKVEKSLKMVENQAASLPRKLGENAYTVNLVSGGSALIEGNGSVIQAMNGNMRYEAGYVIGTQAIYDLQMEVVYDLRENNATVAAIMDNTVFIRAESANGYDIISLKGSDKTTIYSFSDLVEATTVLTFSEYADVYEIHNLMSGDYVYYNADGTVLITTTSKLYYLAGSQEVGTALFWNGDAAAATYYAFS